jgi:tetratricopeptide (TPR) repeat protein
MLAAALSLAQSDPGKAPPDKDGSGNAPDRASAPLPRDARESSSQDTKIDVSAPKDDAKNHPGSQDAVADLDPDQLPQDTSGTQEFHPWNPHKAMKSIEVGDYYFKRKNYKAALDRYKEALYYKDGDAVASFRLAVCQEKLGEKDEAKKYFEAYLKVQPEGQYAKDAHASIERMAKPQ